MIPFNLDPAESGSAPAPFSVSVIGIGGSGTNVIDKICLEGMSGADLVSMNCDARSLQSSMAGTRIQLGKTLTQGLGCGGDPELGAEAAAASSAEIREMLTGRNMVFLCVGLGGGTGSGAAPVIARMAREAGAFVVVFATLPFAFEGRRRTNQAGLALQDLRKYANALVTFENDRMGELVVPKKGVQEAFELADKIIGQSVRAVTNLVTQPGLISIGMDDLITALRNTDSRCLFGYGQAKGENRAVEALGLALKSPLLDRGQMMAGARNVLVHICGGTTLTLFEIETLMRELGKHVHEDAQILFGAATDPKLNEHLSVTVLTSLNKVAPVVEIPAEPAAEINLPPIEEPIVPVNVPTVTAVVPPAGVLVQAASVFIVQAAPSAAPAVVAAPEENTPAVAAPAPAPAPAMESLPPAAPAPAAAPVAPSVVVIEDELFPETVLAVAPVPAPVAEVAPVVKDIPALVVSAPPPSVPVAPVALAPIVQAPQLESHESVEAYQDEIYAEEPHHFAAPEAVAAEMEPVHYAEPEAEWEQPEEAIVEEEEVVAEIPVRAPQPAFEPETVPERVIRIERAPVPAARRAAPDPGPERRPEPQRPIPVAPQAAPPAKRFALSEIIQAKARPASPPTAAPVPDYEEEEEAYVAPPVRQAPAQVSRRAPDYDRISPIRPIPAGRSTTPAPASPFTPAKPVATAQAPQRPVPTQQQTFDERLQPASSGSRFDRAKPTVEEGEDLDVPTFLRRKR